VTGQWTLDDPFAAGQPSSWDGQSEIHGPNRTISTSSSATFTWDGSCLSYDLDAEVNRPLGTDTVTVRNVERCIGQCPASGDVSVIYALGATLSWSYTGDGTATVVGVRGNSFDIALPCSY